VGTKLLLRVIEVEFDLVAECVAVADGVSRIVFEGVSGTVRVMVRDTVLDFT